MRQGRAVKQHDWKIEVVSYGRMGVEDEYVCSRCGAYGGPVDGHVFDPDADGGVFKKITRVKLTPHARLPDSIVKISEDCDEAARQIREFKDARQPA